jgi:hypothetical protein
MDELKSTRTLVKSAPELWAVCSDAALLAEHLGAFGEIRITRMEPETTVAWEGERASGTVRIESSGWGTKVTMTAQTAEVESPPPIEPPSRSKPRRGALRTWLAELFEQGAKTAEPPHGHEHEASPTATSALDAALDSLGQAHRRPFSHG